MKKTGIILGILVTLLLVVLTVVALLPGIMSSNLAKPYVMQQINQRLPGELQIEKWSLRWFGRVEGQGIVYDNRENDLLVKVAGFKTSKGLFQLMTSSDNLGTVEVTAPAVYVYLPDEIKAQLPEETKPPAPREQMAIPGFFGQILITDGSLHTVRANQTEKVVVKGLNLAVDAAGPQNPISYRFAARSGDDSGRASGEGTLAFSPDDPLNMEKIQADSKLQVEDWELRDLLAILASHLAIPAGQGRLNADVSLTGSAAEKLHLSSRLSVDELKLQGGPLGSDTPTVNGLAIAVDAIGNKNGLSLENMAFRSSLANGSAKGVIDPQGQNRFSGNATINMAEVFTQLPNTLQLRAGTQLTEGSLALAAKVETTEDKTAFEGDVRIDQLKGLSDGKTISWDKPVTVNATGEMRPDGLQLKNLALRSSFLNADGQGDLQNMRVNLSADLEAALKELKKFIQIREWEGGGKLKLDLNVKEKSKNLSTASMKLDVTDLVLSRNRQQILPKQSILADVSADIAVADKFENSQLAQPTLTIRSSLANGTFTATNLAWEKAHALPQAKDIKLEMDLSLQQVTPLLKNLAVLSPQIQLGGQAKLSTSGSLSEGLLTLNQTRVDTKQFFYQQDNQTIKEERLTLTTKGQINLVQKGLMLAPIEIDAQPGEIRIPELVITDWTKAPNDIKTRVSAVLDLEKLAKGYGDFIRLPEKTQISGNGRLDADMDFSNPKAQLLKLRGKLEPFKLISESLPTITEKTVKLNMDVTRSPDGKHLTITAADIDSNALSLTADGSLDQVGENKVLAAKGTIALDMALVSDYLKKSGQSKVELSGKEARPFRIKLVSKGDSWEDALQRLDFAAALHVKSVKALGLDLAPNDIPIQVANASADAKLESPANGGKLALQPIITLGTEPYVLSMAENTDILKAVQVTQGLIDGLLASIHPLFKDAVVPQGVLGLHLKHFNWPLVKNAENKATFAGTLQLNGIRLNSTPFLSVLLGMMGVSEREISLTDQSVDFEASDGRISCSPLTLDIEGYPLVMQGTFGFDKTVDFIARVPVTQKMVGKDAYQFLQGTTLKVPIRGTALKPAIDEAAFRDATADLMQQAVQKGVQQGVQDLLQNLLKKK
jgi:hypothetical protein